MSTPRRAVVVDGTLVAPGVRSVRLRMLDSERLGHRAGQYVLLHAHAADGSVVKRAYSIASPPADDPCFEFCVRLIPDQPASTFVHAVTPGTEVSFSGPWGKFVVEDETRDLMLVATGTAISCTGAILAHELTQPLARRVRLLWGLRAETDVHGLERLATLARAHPRFTYQIVLSQPGPSWTGACGRVTALLREQLDPSALYCLAGNGAMIADVEDMLAAAGVSPTAIRKEVFFTPGQVRVPLAERQARAANRARPGCFVVGIALHAGTAASEIGTAIAETLTIGGIQVADVRNLAALAKASDEPGLRDAGAALGLPIEFYLPSEIESVVATLGSPGTCEAVACASAGGTRLHVSKHRTPAVTVAIAAVAPEE